MQQLNIEDVARRQSNEHQTTIQRVPEARYAYYRRCQVFRRNGEQCKSPAEKGAEICHGHAGQQATALRRERELRAVLAEVVIAMRRRCRPEFQAADIFTDFDAIQVTLAVMAQALIDGRIDCKTAGRLAVGLQTASKLLRLYHKVHRETQTEKALTTKGTKGHKEKKILPRICADERRVNKVLTTKDTEGQKGSAQMGTLQSSKSVAKIERTGTARIIVFKRAETEDISAGRAHAPPEWMKAA